MGVSPCSPRCLQAGPEPTSAPAKVTLSYCIDSSDHVCGVNQAWRDFAVKNGGSTRLAERIVGTELWSSISDPHACEIYRQLTVRARAGRHIRFTYRCDAPAQRRTFAMQIEGTPCGGVRFTSELIHAEDRPVVRLLETGTARSGDFVRVCAWCQRVAVDVDQWVEVEEAVNLLGILDADLLPQLTHGMCADCEIDFLATGNMSDGKPA